MATLEDDINQKIVEINELLVAYDLKIDRIANELYVYVDDKIVNLKNYVDSQDSYLEERIEQVEVGQINVYDPTTGLYSPLQIVIDNIYDMGRSNALTSSEYDALELTASEFDAYQITAREYDINGKEIYGTELIGTGTKIQFRKNDIVEEEYTFLIYGDVDGSGVINARDLLVLQRYLLNKAELSIPPTFATFTKPLS